MSRINQRESPRTLKLNEEENTFSRVRSLKAHNDVINANKLL